MLIVSQIKTGSSQLVPGTKTTAGDRTKPVKINRPLRIATGGTLMAFATFEHPCVTKFQNILIQLV